MKKKKSYNRDGDMDHPRKIGLVLPTDAVMGSRGCDLTFPELLKGILYHVMKEL